MGTFFGHHWSVIALLMGIAVVVCKHHGSSMLVQLGGIVAICASVAFYWALRDYSRFSLSLATGGLMIAVPGSHLLYGIWLILLPNWPLFYPLTFAVLCCHIADYLAWGNVPYSNAFLLATIVTGIFATRLPPNVRSVLKLSLAAGCLALTAFETMCVPQSNVNAITESKIPFGYRVGDTVKRVLEMDSPDTKNMRTVRSLLQGDSASSAPGSIILIEHDQWETHPLIASQGNWHQMEPWNENQLLGNQFWLAAIYQDGQFQSNLGGQAIAKGRVLLASPSQNGTGTCLAVETNDVLYLADSDYFCNGMSAYHPALLKEIFGLSSQFARMRLIAILLLAVGICLEFRNLFPWSIAPALAMMASCFIWVPKSVPGDVRIIGRVFDPHETSHASGTLGALNDGGICAVRGNFGAKMLVVAEGLSCFAEKEAVVLLESEASVTIGGNVVSASTLPLGTEGETVDARHLILNGKNTGKAECIVQGIRVIGTGSPAQNIVRLWPRL